MIEVKLYPSLIPIYPDRAYNNYYAEQSQYLFDPSHNPGGGFALPGASFMVYPNARGGCSQSVRQKIFAEGLCDIRLLRLLERKRGKTAVKALIERHLGVPHFHKTVDSPATYLAFLEELYSMLREKWKSRHLTVPAFSMGEAICAHTGAPRWLSLTPDRECHAAPPRGYLCHRFQTR